MSAPSSHMSPTPQHQQPVQQSANNVGIMTCVTQPLGCPTLLQPDSGIDTPQSCSSRKGACCVAHNSLHQESMTLSHDASQWMCCVCICMYTCPAATATTYLLHYNQLHASSTLTGCPVHLLTKPPNTHHTQGRTPVAPPHLPKAAATPGYTATARLQENGRRSKKDAGSVHEQLAVNKNNSMLPCL